MKTPFRVLVAAAAAAALSPFASAQPSPPLPIAGCGVSSGPPVAPQIRLQTPARQGVVRRLGRTEPGGSGAIIAVPGSPLPPWPACAGDISGAISGEVIAPSQIGFAMNLLGEGFHLTSLSLHSDGSCAADGTADAPLPELDTTWTVDGSSAPLFLSQRSAAQGGGNRIDDASASFWWNGYQYAIQLAFVTPAERIPGAAADDTRAILRRAIAELAPGLDLSCFAQPKTGSWADLAALGIGDPRPAIPSGYAESDFSLTYLSTPACAAASPADGEVSLFALFENASGSTIGIGAWSLAGSSSYPGTIQDGLVAWSSGVYQFSVYGDGTGGPLASSVLVPIAQKLDPAFSADCSLQPVTLAPADLPALGFHAPAAPPGYAPTGSSLTGEVVGASCTKHFDFRGTYVLFWSFSSGEGFVITASADRVVSDQPGPRTDPVISDSCISWSDDLGTTFFVAGYSAVGAGGPGQSVLAAVARSMDPGLTIPN